MRSRCTIARSLSVGVAGLFVWSGAGLAVEPEPVPKSDPPSGNTVLLRPGQKMPTPRGIDDNPFPPCTLSQTLNCQVFEYPRAAGTSFGSGGIGGATTNVVCDHFRPVEAGTISDVCWWGTYGAGAPGCGDLPPDADDNFVITYYARAATGLPDTSMIIGGPFSQLDGSLTVSRAGLCDSGGLTSAAFSASHAPVSVSADTCYFIEIRNPRNRQGGASAGTWFWSRTFPAIDNVCYRDLTGDGYAATEAADGDRAFCVGIRWDPFGNGNTQICLPPTSKPPENDNCGNAEAITGTVTVGFDNSNATTGVDGQNNAACNYAGGTPAISRDIWYDWLAAAEGFEAGDLISVTVTTCGSGLIIDSKMAVYNRPGPGMCPAESDLIDCIDDVCDQTPVNDANVAASVTFNAVVGNHYLFQVGGSGVGAAGVQSLFVSSGPAKGRCCLPAGECAVVNEARCAALGGSYDGDGTSCGGTYAATMGTTALEDISATGTALVFTQGDDDYAAAPLPFPLRFYGEEFSSINVGVNGQIAFGGPLYPYANTWTIPTHPVEPNRYAAVAADDFIVLPAATGTGCNDGRILVETRGSAPNRRVIVQWDNVCHFAYGTGDVSDDNTYQAIFHENGDIEYRYESVSAPEITPTGGATQGYIIGLESESGADSVAVDNGTNPPPAAGSSVLFTYTANPAGDCPAGPSCPCDFNSDLVLNSQDFFDFLTAFFANQPSADYNGDTLINSQDFFDFLTCFFEPPTGC